MLRNAGRRRRSDSIPALSQRRRDLGVLRVEDAEGAPQRHLLRRAEPPDRSGGEAVALTVWRKSLLFNCDGFTVFDSCGDLVYRVDNYTSGSKGEIVLMDATGVPLLAVRRKETTNPLFSAKKHVQLLQHKALAQVTQRNAAGGRGGSYDIEGSYSQRCCAVYDENRQMMAEIKRKEAVKGVALGVDVFRLVVQPGFDPAVAMAMVILLEQMFG
ncbi:unnamed protein product [Spirodela intermedia]|uniref:Uncharacterized protein n=1 Tax=Spirodela intermedia TaxID=51605 RepID=A0A7I8IAJ3_SPIIN|nr:unnamed protein product [Spirodela intermedia]CAA6654558.1 unnamed protein product [Spirodela intermedia]